MIRLVQDDDGEDKIRRLFSKHVPELSSGTVEIKAIGREAGVRTMIAVSSVSSSVDPIGCCVGAKGDRIRAIVQQLGGECLDIIPWFESVDRLIMAALFPMITRTIVLDHDGHSAIITLDRRHVTLPYPEELKVRLLEKLLGWRIEVAE